MIPLSVIIPCHNEAGSIADVLRRVRAVLPGAELLVVDDGSTDGTADVAASVDGVRVHRMDVNAGKGVALRRGIGLAAGERLVFIDGDGQDDPEDLPRMLAVDSPFVNGSKFLGTIKDGAISRPNYWGNRFMSGAINLLLGASITDSQSGFRVVDRALVDRFRLRSTEYEIETEMLCKALKAGADVREVGVTRRPRSAGATGFRRVRNGLRVLFMILAERLRR